MGRKESNQTKKKCPSREFFTSQICLLALFAKIKFSKKFPNLKYIAKSSGSVGIVLDWVIEGLLF